MKALVIYESMFGNTRTVAEAIGEGLREIVPTEVVEVGQAPTAMEGDVSLVVLGGPTHALGMSRANTRADAARQAGGAVVSERIGQREWLERAALPPGVRAATFDTRVGTGHFPGSAARGAVKRLRRLGAEPVTKPASFFVRNTPGPLADGEVERARSWGRRLAELTAPAGSGTEGAGR